MARARHRTSPGCSPCGAGNRGLGAEPGHGEGCRGRGEPESLLQRAPLGQPEREGAAEGVACPGAVHCIDREWGNESPRLCRRHPCSRRPQPHDDNRRSHFTNPVRGKGRAGRARDADAREPLRFPFVHDKHLPPRRKAGSTDCTGAQFSMTGTPRTAAFPMTARVVSTGIANCSRTMNAPSMAALSCHDEGNAAGAVAFSEDEIGVPWLRYPSRGGICAPLWNPAATRREGVGNIMSLDTWMNNCSFASRSARLFVGRFRPRRHGNGTTGSTAAEGRALPGVPVHDGTALSPARVRT